MQSIVALPSPDALVPAPWSSPAFTLHLGDALSSVRCADPVLDERDTLYTVACQTGTQPQARCFLLAFQITASGLGSALPWSPLDLGARAPAVLYAAEPVGLLLVSGSLFVPLDPEHSPGNAGLAIVALQTGTVTYLPLGTHYGSCVGTVEIQISGQTAVVCACTYPRAAGTSGASMMAISLNGTLLWQTAATTKLADAQPVRTCQIVECVGNIL